MDQRYAEAALLLIQWLESLDIVQYQVMKEMPVESLASLATNDKQSRIREHSMRASVAAVLYHYFKTRTISDEVRQQIGTQSTLAYYFDLSHGTVARHWSALENWLHPVRH